MDFTAMPQAADFLKNPTRMRISAFDFLLPLIGFAPIMFPMIANFLSALGGSTDGIVISFIKPELEKYLSGIGSVQNIELDTPNKRASVSLAMQGDPNPVKIQIERYSLAPSPAGSLLTIHDYSCPTHEWLAKLAKKFSPTFEIALPVPYAMASAMV